MSMENKTKPRAEEPVDDHGLAESTLKHGASVREHSRLTVAEAVNGGENVYGKTVLKASETYEKVRRYGRRNPGKTILISLGIGVGLGFLLGASSHSVHTGRMARPMVYGLFDVARELLR